MRSFSVGPNRYPYNPLGNNAANGILVGPGGPTGVYGRPYPGIYGRPQYGNINPGYPSAGAGYGDRPYGFDNPYNQLVPFSSKSGAGILADESTTASSKTDSLKKKSN